MAAARIPLIGAILTGGSSRRFGEDKARIIGPLVLAALRDGGVDPIVAVGGDPSALPIPTLPDRYPGEGPLGGVATALTYARTGWVLVVPCDLPALAPGTIAAFVERLGTLEPGTGLVAEVGGQELVSLGCWPASWARAVHGAIRSGARSYRSLLEIGPSEGVEIAAGSLEDADRPDELAALLEHHSKGSGDSLA